MSDTRSIKDEKAAYTIDEQPVDADLSPEYIEYQELTGIFDEARIKALCVSAYPRVDEDDSGVDPHSARPTSM